MKTLDVNLSELSGSLISFLVHEELTVEYVDPLKLANDLTYLVATRGWHANISGNVGKGANFQPLRVYYQKTTR